MPNYYYHQPRPSYKPPYRRFSGLRRGLSFLVVLAVFFFGYHLIRGLTIHQHVLGANKVSASAPPVLSFNQNAQMASQINSVIQAHPDMDIGVAIEDLNNDHIYTYGLTDPFIAASVGKLITATLFLHEVEAGQQPMNQQLSYGTAAYELQQMIEQSDNTAWNDLNTLLTHTVLLNYASQIGMSNYDPDQNTLTAKDIVTLLGKLYKGELLNSAHTNLLLSYMHDANFDTYIPASIPTGVKVYHKAGWLDDRVHDSAIIDNGKHPYVLVIFTKMDDGSSYDANEGHQVFAGITTATVNAFIK
ncbi:MAG: serine hydrolase [Candidatus Saccharimonadales bacterium]